MKALLLRYVWFGAREKTVERLGGIFMQQLGYVVITDYIKANTGEDLSDALQELILQNPNRTIFFPDGEYVIAKPICTPANPVHAVTLLLSNFAVIKAAENWSSTEAMIQLLPTQTQNF